tara:strand:+ start:41880 stop:42572 length:693 start_codon:yes stop_codon:yes gene_type:complete
MKKALFLLTFAFFISHSYAQPYKTIKIYKPYKWMVGVSWSAIDDDGRQFEGIFDVANWNYMVFPTRITLDRYFRYGWSAEAVATYSQYLPDKLVNDSTNRGSTFFSFDLNGKYSFYQKYAPRARWIDPYFTFGVGYTYRNSANVSPHVPTVNLGFGLNIWIVRSLGIQLHSNAKIGVYPGFWVTHTNYLQHSAGIVFRWGEGKKNSNGGFGRKKNKWTKKKPKYKPNKGH